MTFNNLRVKAKGRFLVNLALIAPLLLSGMVTNVTPILAADSRAAAAVDARAAKLPAMDRDAQYAGFEDLASHHRFQRHSEQHGKRASSENEKGDGNDIDANVPVDSGYLCDTKGPICGSTFDMTCGYVSDALFNCEDVGKEPVLDKRCSFKYCESGEKECGTLTACTCKGPGRVKKKPANHLTLLQEAIMNFATGDARNTSKHIYMDFAYDTSAAPALDLIAASTPTRCTTAPEQAACLRKLNPANPIPNRNPRNCAHATRQDVRPRALLSIPLILAFAPKPILQFVSVLSQNRADTRLMGCTLASLPESLQSLWSCSPSKCISVIGDGLGRCDIDPCLCSYTNDRLCGTDFPKECSYNPAAIYNCPEQPARPQLVNACPANNKCANTERGPACQP